MTSFTKTFLTPCIALCVLYGCTKTAEITRHDAHWEYEHPDWANIGYNDCGGNIQSPINIQTSETIKALLGDIQFNYSPFAFTIVDNGHTIQVMDKGGNTISLNGTAFTFRQFHFHAHSEHKIDGAASPMELHLVHQDAAKNILVLGIMLEEGAPNPFVENIWKHIPTEKKKEIATTETVQLLDVLPANKSYYNYTGSLTTPPCSQGLQWIVFKNKVTLSKPQIERFTKIYHDNVRPIQPLNNRLVLEKTN
jgi:carbonic anhydrase